MPWKEMGLMSMRLEFVRKALQPDANISQLCQEYGISRKTGYKWIQRYRREGESGLVDHSRRPRESPGRTGEKVEAALLEVRDEHPKWSGYKIKAYLQRAGWGKLPSHSTIHAILKRNDRIDPRESDKHRAFQRFEMEQANQLWQMDFKGDFLLGNGQRCHPLTVLDDHSRFLLGLCACSNETMQSVQKQLTKIFREYGLPERMLMDNASPWRSHGYAYSAFTVWLMRLGISVSHGRPFHPQTQGKDERLHRTLKAELLEGRTFTDFIIVQQQFDHWRDMYNLIRPHQALGMIPPVECYTRSSRPFPEQLPEVEYDQEAIVRKVDGKGKISFQNHAFRVGKAFRGFPVAVWPAEIDGEYEVYFCHQKIAHLSRNEDNC